MGMKVLAVKRHVSAQENSDPIVDHIYGPDHRIEMVSRCDYVVVAAPLNAETHGLISEAEFAGMKPNAVITNGGRGPLIEEPAMSNDLSEHQNKRAAPAHFVVSTP